MIGLKEKEKVTKTSIHIPSELWRRVKVAAAKSDKRISEVLSEAIEQWLAKHEREDQ
ncbi:MAG: ribbon-helix-helix protein, CopG family [Candidatus Jordarchaeaceae archaeon]